MNHRILIALAFVCLAPQTYAKGHSAAAAMEASHFASALTGIHKPEDLLLLPLKSKDRDAIKSEIANKVFANFKPPQITMPTAETILVTADSQNITLDFSSITERVMKLNGRAIQLQPQKTYFNYKGEISSILNSSGKKSALMNLLVPEAAAGPISFLQALFGGGASSEAHRLDELNLSELQDVSAIFVNSYEADSLAAKEASQKLGMPIHWSTFTFTCDGVNLASVESKVLISDGHDCGLDINRTNCSSWDPMYHGIFRLSDGTYEARNPMCAKAVSQIAPDGTVMRGPTAHSGPSSGCPVKGKNLNQQGPFFGFFGSAQACCGKAGCAEKVNAAVKSLKDDLIAAEAPKAPESATRK